MNNQALIATLTRVKAVSQLRVSHDGPLVVTSGGASTPLSPAGFVGSA